MTVVLAIVAGVAALVAAFAIFAGRRGAAQLVVARRDLEEQRLHTARLVGAIDRLADGSWQGDAQDAPTVVRLRAQLAAAVAGDTAAAVGDFTALATVVRAQAAGQRDDATATFLRELSSALDRLSQRDLTVRIGTQHAGELGRIAEAFNRATGTLDAAFEEVVRASEQVNVASAQISAGSQGMADLASEQASTLEEVAASLQETGSVARQNAANASEARGLAEGARAAATDGVTSMQRLSDAVAQIKTSSDQTMKIVKTIDEIAFQTNLLALNAAVEAARAGDAGRGFAVVAEEVRALALRAAEAARNTSTLIEESARHTAQGVAESRTVASQLADIDARAAKVGEVMAEIAAASEQQTQAVTQINVAVDQLNGSTQRAAANAQESASAAAELSSQAASVLDLVGTFTLGDTDAAAAHATRTAATIAPAAKPASAPKSASVKPATAKAPMTRTPSKVETKAPAKSASASAPVQSFQAPKAPVKRPPAPAASPAPAARAAAATRTPLAAAAPASKAAELIPFDDDGDDFDVLQEF